MKYKKYGGLYPGEILAGAVTAVAFMGAMLVAINSVYPM